MEKIEAAIKRKSRKIEGRMNASKEFFFEKETQGDWVMIGDDSPVKNEEVVKMVIIPITITMPLLEPESSNASAIVVRIDAETKGRFAGPMINCIR